MRTVVRVAPRYGGFGRRRCAGRRRGAGGGGGTAAPAQEAAQRGARLRCAHEDVRASAARWARRASVRATDGAQTGSQRPRAAERSAPAVSVSAALSREPWSASSGDGGPPASIAPGGRDASSTGARNAMDRSIGPCALTQYRDWVSRQKDPVSTGAAPVFAGAVPRTSRAGVSARSGGWSRAGRPARGGTLRAPGARSAGSGRAGAGAPAARGGRP
jgi:hypothetical protein